MFAYCLNNPVNLEDHTGLLPGKPRTVAIEDGARAEEKKPTPLRNFANKISENVGKALDYVFNDDEQKALDSGPISFYKGAPVVHLPIDIDPFSVGVIFLGSETKNWDNAVETMQHEYGHSVHLSQIGVSAYLSTVAVPSVIGHSFAGYNQYYSQPWECVADIFGGVITRTDSYGQPYQYSTNAWLLGLYWTYTYILP